MRARFRGALVSVVLPVAGGLIVTGIAWQIGRAHRGDHDLRVYSHNGRWVLKPSLVMPSSPGQPPDFKSSGPPGLILIPRHLATEGREILVSGPGCGLLRGKFEGQHRVTLPPPIRATIRVPGEFDLPSGDHGISLTFRASGVPPEVASAAAGAPVEASHWKRPESPVWDEQIWLDPATRSVSVLLPFPGEWEVKWMHTERPKPGKSNTFGIGFGWGESLLTIASDGAELTLAVDPEDLDKMGAGLGGD
jgi:hypothetical protein